MTAISTITQDTTHVKERLLASGGALIGPLLEGPLLPGAAAERRDWQLILAVRRLVLEVMLSRACLAATLQASPSAEPLRSRLDGSYTIQQTTTLGVNRVPLFAYFDAGDRVRAPARASVFPSHGQCRSSDLAPEWEARLGSLLPFQQAEEAMRFFNHDGAPVEDTTIALHQYAVGRLLDRRWTFRTPDTIRAFLTDRSNRHRDTGRPLLYASTDDDTAHQGSQYVIHGPPGPSAERPGPGSAGQGPIGHGLALPGLQRDLVQPAARREARPLHLVANRAPVEAGLPEAGDHPAHTVRASTPPAPSSRSSTRARPGHP